MLVVWRILVQVAERAVETQSMGGAIDREIGKAAFSDVPLFHACNRSQEVVLAVRRQALVERARRAEEAGERARAQLVVSLRLRENRFGVVGPRIRPIRDALSGAP